MASSQIFKFYPKHIFKMNQQKGHIASIGTAVPYPISTERFLEKDKEMREFFDQPDPIINRMKKFVEGTGIHTRHYAHPHWLPEGQNPEDYPEVGKGALSEDIFTKANYTPKFHERMAFYHDTCVQLAIEASKKALKEWEGEASEISHIITTCTSGWNEPGIAVSVMQALDLSLDCQKAELNFNGCFCGATCLRLANDIIRAGDATGVLVVAVEVASTHYDIHATDLSSLVAHSLFADGAAAVIIAPEGKWKYIKTGMSLVPDSDHLLGLSPPLDEKHLSYRMHLDKNTGKSLGAYFKHGLGQHILDKLYDPKQPIRPALGIHPGGPNILDNVLDVFQSLGWSEDAMDNSYGTLQSYGNLGAAAMLFVLADCWKEIEKSELVTMAFGPGVTVEWAMLTKTEVD
jgi:predicted naringenin-chalcone synthase